jgi:NitT/TauT family transport system permease protein
MGRIFNRPLTRQLIGLAVLLIVWQAAANTGWLNPLYMPSPLKIGAALAQLFGSGSIWPHLAATFTAALGGLAIGIIVGVVLGAAAAILPLIAELLEPVMILLNAVPRVVLAPLFLLWFGLGIWSKVALAVTLVFFVMFFNTFQGVRDADRVLIDNVRMLGASERQLVRHVLVPSALTWIFSSLQTSLGFAMVGAVVGEYLGSARGLGYVISQAEGTFDTTGVFAGMFVLAVVVVVVSAGVTRVERYLLRWKSS